jgi:hypothetical protein
MLLFFSEVMSYFNAATSVSSKQKISIGDATRILNEHPLHADYIAFKQHIGSLMLPTQESSIFC